MIMVIIMIIVVMVNIRDSALNIYNSNNNGDSDNEKYIVKRVIIKTTSLVVATEVHWERPGILRAAHLMFFKQIIHSCTFFGHARGREWGRGRGDHVRGRVAWGGGGGRGIEREGHDSHRWRRGQSCLVRQRGRIRRSSSLSLVLALLTYPRDSPNTLELTEHLEINSKWPEIPPKKNWRTTSGSRQRFVLESSAVSRGEKGVCCAVQSLAVLSDDQVGYSTVLPVRILTVINFARLKQNQYIFFSIFNTSDRLILACVEINKYIFWLTYAVVWNQLTGKYIKRTQRILTQMLLHMMEYISLRGIIGM